MSAAVKVLGYRIAMLVSGGGALVLAYGLALGEWPIVAANAVTLALSATILAVKVLEDRKRRPAPPA